MTRRPQQRAGVGAAGGGGGWACGWRSPRWPRPSPLLSVCGRRRGRRPAVTPSLRHPRRGFGTFPLRRPPWQGCFPDRAPASVDGGRPPMQPQAGRARGGCRPLRVGAPSPWAGPGAVATLRGGLFPPRASRGYCRSRRVMALLPPPSPTTPAIAPPRPPLPSLARARALYDKRRVCPGGEPSKGEDGGSGAGRPASTPRTPTRRPACLFRAARFFSLVRLVAPPLRRSVRSTPPTRSTSSTPTCHTPAHTQVGEVDPIDGAAVSVATRQRGRRTAAASPRYRHPQTASQEKRRDTPRIGGARGRHTQEEEGTAGARRPCPSPPPPPRVLAAAAALPAAAARRCRCAGHAAGTDDGARRRGVT